MKRLIILLLSILISFSLFAGILDSADLNVLLSVTPESYGVVELRDSSSTEEGKYNVYNADGEIALSVDDNLYGAGEAYLYFYAVGPESLNIKVEILSPLRQGGSASSANSFHYSITFDTSGGNWQGGNFSKTTINSQDATSATASTNGEDYPQVMTTGVCKLSFKTLKTIVGKSYGQKYVGEIKVTLESA